MSCWCRVTCTRVRASAVHGAPEPRKLWQRYTRTSFRSRTHVGGCGIPRGWREDENSRSQSTGNRLLNPARRPRFPARGRGGPGRGGVVVPCGGGAARVSNYAAAGGTQNNVWLLRRRQPNSTFRKKWEFLNCPVKKWSSISADTVASNNNEITHLYLSKCLRKNRIIVKYYVKICKIK